MQKSKISVVVLTGVFLIGLFGMSWAANNPFDEDTAVTNKQVKVSIAPLPLEELVGISDIIAIGILKETKNTWKRAQGFQVQENVFEITRVLKGSLKAGDSIKVTTLKGLEDEAKLAKKEKALLFLVKDKKTNVVSFNNGVQGCWPIDSKGVFSGMGTGESLTGIRKSIQKGPIAPRKLEIPVPAF